MPVAKEQIRQIITENNISSVSDVYTLLKESFKDKMLYLASENVVKKWTQRYRNWDQVLNQLTVLYGERLTGYL